MSKKTAATKRDILNIKERSATINTKRILAILNGLTKPTTREIVLIAAIIDNAVKGIAANQLRYLDVDDKLALGKLCDTETFSIVEVENSK